MTMQFNLRHSFNSAFKGAFTLCFGLTAQQVAVVWW